MVRKKSGAFKRKLARAVYDGSKYSILNASGRMHTVALRKRLRALEADIGMEAAVFRQAGVFDPAKEMASKLSSANSNYSSALKGRREWVKRDKEKHKVARKTEAAVIKWARKNK